MTDSLIIGIMYGLIIINACILLLERRLSRCFLYSVVITTVVGIFAYIIHKN
jgi:hypothetical protein